MDDDARAHRPERGADARGWSVDDDGTLWFTDGSMVTSTCSGPVADLTAAAHEALGALVRSPLPLLETLPAWRTFAATWGPARPRTVCTFCEGSGEVDDENWSPDYYPATRSYRDGIIDCGWCDGDGWVYVDRYEAAQALLAALLGD